MMKNKDLQGLIREMAARLDAHQSDDIGPCPGVLSEVEAYMAVDATLASLYKQYMDARRNRLRALEQQGEGSAMADIARDLAESAQSAMETRMIELREDQMKRLMVERMMAHASYGVDEHRASSAEFYARREAEFAAAQRQDRLAAARHVRESEDSFLALMTMWWMMRQMAWRTQVRLSLASSFSRALHRAFERDPDYVTGTA